MILEESIITNLEIKVSYLEDFLNQIQEVCVKQSEEIEQLHRQVKAIKSKISEMNDQLESDIPNRKPPHY